jgi:hypothetical protein
LITSSWRETKRGGVAVGEELALGEELVAALGESLGEELVATLGE